MNEITASFPSKRLAPGPGIRPGPFDASEAKRLRKAVGISQGRFAAALGLSLRTISRWETGKTSPRGPTRQRLQDLDRLIDRASEVLSPEGVGLWLTTPNAALGDQVPLEASRTPEGYIEVMNLLGRMEWGIPT
ncbi:MAG: antitoxin Xre/MbcA/ParS toxin-binding domain-containing protein [Chloroflexota bacterium]